MIGLDTPVKGPSVGRDPKKGVGYPKQMLISLSGVSVQTTDICCQTPFGLSTCSMLGRALHSQPRITTQSWLGV